MKAPIRQGRTEGHTRTSRLGRWVRRAGLFGGITGSLAILLDAGGGVEAGPPPGPQRHLSREDIGSYTYEYDQDRGFCVVEKPVDPINVIFVYRGWPVNVYQHGRHHGEWEVRTDGPSEIQCFADHPSEYGSLQQQHGSNASNDGRLKARYHMRYRTGSHPGGELDWDPTWRVYAVAAAHHEDFVIPCGHAVDANFDPFDDDKPYGVSGFDMGRNEIFKNWVENGQHHTVLRTEYWGNTWPMRQCDGEYAWSDGYVYYFRLRTVREIAEYVQGLLQPEADPPLAEASGGEP